MGVFLAPMAGLTDLSFRLLARELGADLVVTEMISAQALLYGNLKTRQMLTIHPQERPVAVQLFGRDPHLMAEAAQIALELAAPEMIDLNFGCPTPKIVKNGYGAALLKTPRLVGEIAEKIVAKIPVPVTAKIRLGWDQNSINCLEVAERLAAAGVHWITVHGRTRDQYYAGRADWDWIARVKAQSSVPIVGNGDIFSPEDAAALLERSGCDHLAVGRGALGNPWIFSRIKAFLEEKRLPPRPTLAEKAAWALRHLEIKVKYRGEKQGVREMRPHLTQYLKGTPRSAQLRREINSASTFQEMKDLLELSAMSGKTDR